MKENPQLNARTIGPKAEGAKAETNRKRSTDKKKETNIIKYKNKI